MKKIAFCFLIYDEINNEDLWNIFFNNIDHNLYNIYIHYKTDTPLKYFEKYKLKNCIETKYDDYTICLAYNILFNEAYKDKDNYKFVILSNSCIPFKSFNHIYNKLTNDDYGYFNISSSSQCFPNCNSLIEHIDKDLISKSHNWFILNRILVENLTFDKEDYLKTVYKNVYAPAEYFYYTNIRILKLENQIITTDNISNNATTFTNWEGNDYINPSRFGLMNYNYISINELVYLLNSKCLFGRKFTKNCNDYLKNISQYINGITSII